MPAIRDIASGSTPSSVSETITCVLPKNEQNDLLLLFIVYDVGTPTWTFPENWVQLFAQSQTSGAHGVCAYKLSSGSEPASIDVVASAADSMCYTFMSIMDVNITHPFGNPAVFTSSGHASAAIQNLPQITTNTDNSLVVFLSGTTSTISHEYNNSHTRILSEVHAGECAMSTAWLFKRTAGQILATKATSYASTSAAGVVASLQIAPPSGGATIIPPYMASDDSFSIITTRTNPEAISANFAGLYDKTLQATSTLNSFSGYHLLEVGTGMNVRTNVSLTVNDITGGAYAFSAVDLSERNVLAFLRRSSSPENDQKRLGSIAKDAGVFFGLRSAQHTNIKLWHVSGRENPEKDIYYLPIIINPDAPVLWSTGSLNASSVTGLVVAFNSDLSASLGLGCSGFWALGTGVIAGGTQSNPLTTISFAEVFGAQSDKLTVRRQGASEILSYQNIQVGDGGSNPVILSINGGALEFAGQHSKADFRVNYNSVDNKIGLTYCPGASDVISHINSVVSSVSRFKWGLHADASTSATYDFTRLSVIGAGAITLNKAITIDRLVINDYVTADVSNATLTNCTIALPPAANDSLTTNGSTSLTGCTIDVSTVASGNRWCSVADPSIFENCSFTGGGGHAIRITTPGTYSFSGNSFTGFGANGTDGAAIFNDSGGAVTINVSGGTTPTYKNGTSASTTINNSATLLIEANTSLVGAEVRIYDYNDPPSGFGDELSGAESHNAATYSYAGAVGNVIWVQIMKTGYEEFGQEYTIPSGGGTLAAIMKAERNA